MPDSSRSIVPSSPEQDLTQMDLDNPSTPSSSKVLAHPAKMMAKEAISHSLSFMEKDEIADVSDDESSMASKQSKNRHGGIGTRLISLARNYFKKMDNRMQYLASVFIDNNPHLVRAFKQLSFTRMDQIGLLEIWWTICEDRPKMSKVEFERHYNLKEQYIGGENYASRMFREMNLTRSSDDSSISFEHWATGTVRWCSYSYHNCLALAFRLMSRSGGAIDELGTLRGDGRKLYDPPGDGRDVNLDPYFKKRVVRESVDQKKMKGIKNKKVYSLDQEEFMTAMESGIEPLEPPAFDLTDLRQWFDHVCFAAYGYGSVAPRKIDKLKSVMRIYGLMNVDDSGGVDLDEFARFAWRNQGCLLLAHLYQERMRQVVFGKEYWQKRRDKLGGKLRRTRKRKAVKAKAIREKENTNTDTNQHHHHHHHHHHHLAAPTSPISPTSPIRKFGQRSGSKSLGSPKSFMSFSSFHERQQNKSMFMFLPGGNGIDIDGDDDGWQLLMDQSVLVLKKVDRLKSILQSMQARRPRSSANLPRSSIVGLKSPLSSSSSPAHGLCRSGSIRTTAYESKSPTVTGQTMNVQGTSPSSLGGNIALTRQKSVKFKEEQGESENHSMNVGDNSLEGSLYLTPTGGGKFAPPSIEDDIAEQEAKRKVEHALTKVQREQFALDFGTVVAKTNWEVAGKKRQELGITERTFKQAIPDTRWPVVKVKLNIEAFQPHSPKPQVSPPSSPNRRFGRLGTPTRLHASKATSSPNPQASSPLLGEETASEKPGEMHTPVIADEQPEEVDKSTEPKQRSIVSPSGGGWLSRAASVVGSGIAAAGQTLRLSTPKKEKKEFRVNLTLHVELEDLAGEWPGGESIANRVIIAQQLEHRNQARAALSRTEAKCEAHLMRLDRLKKNEFDGGLYQGESRLASGIGWDGGPMGPPWYPGGPTSHIKGGTGAREKELIEYSPVELLGDYLSGKQKAEETAALTKGEASIDSGLIIKATYRKPR